MMIWRDRIIDTPLIVDPDMSQADLETEWELMIKRSILTQQLCAGLIGWEFYLDWMAQHGYEPEMILDTAEENLEFIIKNQIEVDE